MKTIFRLNIAGLLIIGVASCSETNEPSDRRIETVYENVANKGITSPSLLDDNLVRVERIGVGHPISSDIRTELKRAGLEADDLVTGSLKRFEFNYTPCNLYSIEQKDCSERLILFEYDGIFLIARAKLESAGDTVQLFELHTLDGDLCYSVEISGSNRIGNIIIEKNRTLNEFRISVSDQAQVNSGLKGVDAELCRDAGSWSSCFNCSMEFCSAKWYCALAVAAYPLEFIAGWAASCIGA